MYTYRFTSPELAQARTLSKLQSLSTHVQLHDNDNACNWNESRQLATIIVLDIQNVKYYTTLTVPERALFARCTNTRKLLSFRCTIYKWLM